MPPVVLPLLLTRLALGTLAAEAVAVAAAAFNPAATFSMVFLPLPLVELTPLSPLLLLVMEQLLLLLLLPFKLDDTTSLLASLDMVMVVLVLVVLVVFIALVYVRLDEPPMEGNVSAILLLLLLMPL